MSEPIKMGDLVMVVHSCCTKRVTHAVYHVAKFLPNSSDASTAGVYCSECWTPMPNYREMAGPTTGCAQPIEWLKRIPPLDELEDVKRDEEITV